MKRENVDKKTMICKRRDFNGKFSIRMAIEQRNIQRLTHQCLELLWWWVKSICSRWKKKWNNIYFGCSDITLINDWPNKGGRIQHLTTMRRRILVPQFFHACYAQIVFCMQHNEMTMMVAYSFWKGYLSELSSKFWGYTSRCCPGLTSSDFAYHFKPP